LLRLKISHAALPIIKSEHAAYSDQLLDVLEYLVDHCHELPFISDGLPLMQVHEAYAADIVDIDTLHTIIFSDNAHLFSPHVHLGSKFCVLFYGRKFSFSDQRS
jgi:hypothetical protein